MLLLLSVKASRIKWWIAVWFLSAAFPVSAESPDVRETPVVRVVRDWAPAVVNIGTEQVVLLRRDPFWGSYGNELDRFFAEQFSAPPVSALKLKSVGSGVVIRSEGLILTNAHVVNRASKIFVTFNNGQTVEGKAAAVSQKNDVALIKIDPPPDLKVIQLAEPNDILVGETVVAVGNPLGLENSVTVGVVSGKNRDFRTPQGNLIFSGLIQTDASINVGNSGGALLNLEGKLVGINLAVLQNAQNIGFAISSDTIRTLLAEYDQLVQNQRKKEKSIQIPVKVVRS